MCRMSIACECWSTRQATIWASLGGVFTLKIPASLLWPLRFQFDLNLIGAAASRGTLVVGEGTLRSEPVFRISSLEIFVCALEFRSALLAQGLPTSIASWSRQGLQMSKGCQRLRTGERVKFGLSPSIEQLLQIASAPEHPCELRCVK